MSRSTRMPGARRATITLCIGSAILSGFACKPDTGMEPSAVSEPPTQLTSSSSLPLEFQQVTAGGYHSCGITLDSQAYCWGANTFGQLGDGTTVERIRPVPVAGGLRFRQLEAGDEYTCGLTLEDRAFCWGFNSTGVLGDGTTVQRPRPVRVAGTLRFIQISTGVYHTCGITSTHLAYCWGENLYGEVGDGTVGVNRLLPVLVAGGRRFRQVSAARGPHSCAVTASDRAYCWGLNTNGQLGTGNRLQSITPIRVASQLFFTQITTGGDYTCALINIGRAYCWGSNNGGQLGDGTGGDHIKPYPVAGKRLFRSVASRGVHTCGVTLWNVGYCWSFNFYGQAGDGTTIDRLAPVRVVGGLQFSQVVAAQGSHTCGLTIDHLAYCWGWNGHGQLGDGTTENQLTPVAVVGPS